MPNGYTVLPNIVPGNLWVQGDVKFGNTWPLPALRAAIASDMIQLDCAWGMPRVTIESMDCALRAAAFTDHLAHSHTGGVIEDAIWHKVIKGGLLRLNNAIEIRAALVSTVQGATASTIRVRFGATAVAAYTLSATGTVYLVVYVANRAATGSQIVGGWVIKDTAIVALAQSVIAVDSSVDQGLDVTIQNGAASDAQTGNFCHYDLMNTFGPV